MLSPPVLMAIAVGACVAVGIGIWLGTRDTKSDGRLPSDGEVGSSEVSAGQSPKVSSRPVPAFSSDELSRRLALPLDSLKNHRPGYRTVRIEKPKGGFRQLEIPDDDTKAIQRTILRRLLQAIDAHPLACGFEEGASIVDAAIPHQKKSVVVKLDIRRFFESTTAERIHAWFESIGWDAESAELLSTLTTYNGHLPQGAPTSPRLSNLVNAPLDHALLQLARKHRGNYTRYADDITLSFRAIPGRRIRGICQVVRRILRSYGYAMHGGRKLRILRQHQQQLVLGLVVNSRVAIPRKTRRWLRAVRHRLDNGGETTITESQLRGWESLVAMVEDQREDDSQTLH